MLALFFITHVEVGIVHLLYSLYNECSLIFVLTPPPL
jgi:hypothetical protein